VHGETVPEQQRVPRSDPIADLGIPHVVMQLVGHEHHDDVPTRGGVRDAQDLEPGLARLLDARGPFAQADDHVDARVLEVQGVGVALGAEADDGDGLAVEEGEVCVVVVEHGRRILSRRRSSDVTAIPAPTSVSSAMV
jgi:hypothetical protein